MHAVGRAPGYMGTGRKGMPSITWSQNTMRDPLIAASSAFAAFIIQEASKAPVRQRKAIVEAALDRVRPGTAKDAARRKAELIRKGTRDDQATFDGMRLAIVNSIADRLVQAGKAARAGKPLQTRAVQGLGLYPWDPWVKLQEDGYSYGHGMDSNAQALSGLGNIFEDAWNKVVEPALCVTGAVAGTIVSPAAGAIQQGQAAIGCGAKQLRQQRDIARLQAEQAATMERMQSAQLASRERSTKTLLIAGGIGAVLLVTVLVILK